MYTSFNIKINNTFLKKNISYNYLYLYNYLQFLFIYTKYTYIIWVKFCIYLSFTFSIYTSIAGKYFIIDSWRFQEYMKKENLQKINLHKWHNKKTKWNIQTCLHICSRIIFSRWIAKSVTLVKILVSESLYRNIALTNILHALRQRFVN